MKKILFVCLGNICRSPLAEGILKHKAAENGLDIEVDSCGTANYHVGESPDARSVKVANKYGVDLSNLRGRQFNIGDFEIFDRIFVMDKSNLDNVLALSLDENHHKKVQLFLSVFPGVQDANVPDPYYGGDKGFEEVFKMLSKACDKLVSELVEYK